MSEKKENVSFKERKRIWETLDALYARHAGNRFRFSLSAEPIGLPQFVFDSDEGSEFSVAKETQSTSHGQAVTMSLIEHIAGSTVVIAAIEFVPDIYYNIGALTDDGIVAAAAMRKCLAI